MAIWQYGNMAKWRYDGGFLKIENINEYCMMVYNV
jgi:hypothetical protein